MKEENEGRYSSHRTFVRPRGCLNGVLGGFERCGAVFGRRGVAPVVGAPRAATRRVVSGDPTSPGEFTLLVSMPDGYRLPPHFHPSHEHVEVREGTLLIGIGAELDPKRTQALAAGDSATAPAGIHHFSIARGRTVVSATFNGPFTITYLRAADAPRPRTFPFGY